MEFVKLNDEKLLEAENGFLSEIEALSRQSTMHTTESLKLIAMCIGHAVITEQADTLESSLRNLGVHDGVVNYVDTAIENLSLKYFGAGNE